MRHGWLLLLPLAAACSNAPSLGSANNNISSAAKLLGISRPTLYDLMKQYGLQP